MYSSLYKIPKRDILDNRKFINPNSLVYEAPPKISKYIPDETLEEKINYSYGKNLKDTGAGEIYSYRFDSNYTGTRDEANGVISKLVNNSNRPLDLDSTIQYDRFNNNKVKVDVDQIKESYKNPSNNHNKDNHNKDNHNKDNHNKDNHNKDEETCSADSDGVINICGGLSNQLFPIMDPRFNLREAAKNMILLEDHLFQNGKRCQDCILKHCLTIEGFLEEGITLDIKGEYLHILENSFNEHRKIFKEISHKKNNNTLTNEDCFRIAQNIRKIRKPLCQQFATFI
jgi:hypothetical protein